MVTDSPAFRALADPTRRALLDLLADGPLRVHEMAARFPVSRPAISKHLRLLREAGLVTERKEGRESWYSLDAVPLADVDAWIEKYRAMWQSRLERLKRRVESRRTRPSPTGPRTRTPRSKSQRGEES
jgi:DNA-binding transcriptional ArsR family regulator